MYGVGAFFRKCLPPGAGLFVPLAALLVMLMQLAQAASVVDTPPTDTLEQRIKACTGCHGAQGRATNDGYYPRIAGKPAGYLFNQLTHFRDGRRKHPSMAYMVRYLPDSYLREIAQHFADQHPPYPAAQTSNLTAAVTARGEQLVKQGDPTHEVPACSACHGQALLGVEPAVPGLLGLPHDYLYAQFASWRNGQRHAQQPDCMEQVAKRLSEEDIITVVSWLSAQTVPADARPAISAGAKLPLQCGSITP